MKHKEYILQIIEWAVDISKHLLFWGTLWGVLVYAIWQIGN